MLTAVDPGTLSTDDLVAWALPKTANQFWMRGDSAAARTVLAEVRARVGEHAAAGALDALAATFALNAGELTEARATAGDILARPGAGDLAVAWAAATATLAAARAGDLEPVADLAARGLLVRARRDDRPEPEFLMPMWAGTRLDQLVREVRGR